MRVRRLNFAMLSGLAVLLAACTLTAPAPVARYEFHQPQMGLPFRIVLYAPEKSRAERAAAAAFKRIEELNAILSDYDPDSELSRLSRSSGQGKAVRVSPELWTVLERAQRLAEASGGAFDVTVGPAVNLWRHARRVKQLPNATRLTRAREAIGYQKMRLNPAERTVELSVPNMRLDLGGIAKGYAIDEALRVLRKNGMPRAMVSGGGDIAVGDPPPGKRGWSIELPAMDATGGEQRAFVLLARAALATSGDLFQYLEIGGKRYSHIVDPRTGIGLTDQSLVVVIAKDCMTADSVATAASVMRPEEGLRLIERKRSVEVRMSRRTGEQVQMFESAGFAKSVVRAADLD